MTRTGFSSRARIHPWNPTAVCFLFDTAFLWRSNSGNNNIQRMPVPPGSQKSAFKDKIRVPGCVSRRTAPESASTDPRSAPYKALTGCLLHFYCPRFHLVTGRSPPLGALSNQVRPAQRKAEGGMALMYEFNPQSLWLIPAVLAVGFMLWMLWNLQKEIKR